MANMAMTPAEYLKRPYARVLRPESDGSFSAEILEFPGCFAAGETGSEALQNLENVAESWILGVLAKNERVPEPLQDREAFSGKLVLRLPRSLHKKAAFAAEREGVSLNQFISACVAEAVGVSSGRDLAARKESLNPINWQNTRTTVGRSSTILQLPSSVAFAGTNVFEFPRWSSNQSSAETAPRQSKEA
jgi:antitoxin HicB